MKKVVITGCSRGLGRAMSAEFQKRGHLVVGCSSRWVPKEAEDEGVRILQCDVADDRQVERFSSQILEGGEPPDLLINNAAIINRSAPLWEISSDEFSRLIDVNIKGVANVIRHLLPAMVESGNGVIVNFSSYWGRSTSPEVAPYCASKWAIEGMTKALAQELPGGMAAVALNPGVIFTDMLARCFGENARSHISPEDWAEVAVPFIDSLDASNNGDSLTVPGQ